MERFPLRHVPSEAEGIPKVPHLFGLAGRYKVEHRTYIHLFLLGFGNSNK